MFLLDHFIHLTAMTSTR